ncbi:helix-turn-helix transcriptional regulator [Macrococcus equipercicus]|uniref:Helix-turn-helix transcriptional regulator n=1 Tax=Macrococcus equipercicus TaxID=69967 RepID=A0ABQ6RB79_9STAP|nr:helix-turn-helix transcriptional regulator [Macrococcus equipercicus]KAA1042475.1 helix-turn-helix transcriptional regulator [Macrococcus equipercicus]
MMQPIISQRLKAERLNLKLTQKQFSEKIGISRSYYSDIENGRAIPSVKVLFLLNDFIPIFLNINDADRRQKEVK